MSSGKGPALSASGAACLATRGRETLWGVGPLRAKPDLKERGLPPFLTCFLQSHLLLRIVSEFAPNVQFVG